MIFDDVKKIKNRSELPQILKSWGLNNCICEIGIRYGYHLRELLTCDPKILIGIDLYRDDENIACNDTALKQEKIDAIYQKVFHQFLYDNRVKIFRDYSINGAQVIDNFSLDFCYIDADHTKDGCLRDIGAFWHKVRYGGIIGGHDYVNINARNGVPFGVIDAVAEFMEAKKINKKYLHVTEEEYPSWYILKLDGVQ